MPKLKTKEQFVQESILTHGDLYDYSLVDYIDCKTKVKIICKEHSIFEQTPDNHKRGAGCFLCKGSHKKTTTEFVAECQKIHGDVYDYSLVDYLGCDTKVKIICKKHSIFQQRPSTHLRGAGCKKCKGLERKTTEAFISESKKVHGDKYDYSLTKYTNALTKVIIICPKHGAFSQIPNNHLYFGCLQCSGNARKTTKDFIESASQIHNQKYDYSLVAYKTNRTKVKIVCPVHGVFEQAPFNHLKGIGCSRCSTSGFNPGKPATLYFLRFQKDIASFWKIGITNRNVSVRYKSEKDCIAEIYQWHFSEGADALSIEKEVLAKFANHKIKLPLLTLLDNGGDTECFTLSMPSNKVIKFIESKSRLYPRTSF